MSDVSAGHTVDDLTVQPVDSVAIETKPLIHRFQCTKCLKIFRNETFLSNHIASACTQEPPQPAKRGQKSKTKLSVSKDKGPWSTENVLTLISAYEAEEALYNTSLPEYADLRIRRQGFANILQKMKPTMPTLTLDCLKKKIRACRIAYVAERNKINASKKNGPGDDNVYKPSLWYYDKLEFLQNHILLQWGRVPLNMKDSIRTVTPRRVRGSGAVKSAADSMETDPHEAHVQLQSVSTSANISRECSPSCSTSPTRATPEKSKGTKRVREEAYDVLYDIWDELKSMGPPSTPIEEDDEEPAAIVGRYVAVILKRIKVKYPKKFRDARARVLSLVHEIEAEADEDYSKT